MPEYNNAVRDDLGKVNRSVALFIWLCHLGGATFFCDRAIAYGIKGYYWAAALLVVSSLPYILAVLRNNFIPVEGIFLFLGGIVVGFTAYLFLPVAEIDINPTAWEHTMKFATFGTAAFLVGYWTIFGRMISGVLPIKRFVISNRDIARLPIKFYLIGWGLRIFPIFLSAAIGLFEKIGLIGMPLKVVQKMQGWEISSILTTYGIYAGILIDAYIFFTFSKDIPGRVRKRYVFCRLAFFFTTEIIYAFFSGMAGPVIRPIILLFLVYIKTKNKMPIILLALILSLFLFLAVPFIKTFRERYWYGQPTKTSLQYAVNEMSDKDRVIAKQRATLKRLSNPLEMAVISYKQREEGKVTRTYEDTLEYLSRFMPRFIWPDKPAVDYNKIGRDLGLISQDDYATAISLTLVGGLIMDNGPDGVLIGMFIAGIIVSILWNWLVVRAQGNILAFVIYVILIYRWIFPDDFYAVFHSMLSFAIYAYLLSGFINRRYYKSVKAVA